MLFSVIETPRGKICGGGTSQEACISQPQRLIILIYDDGYVQECILCFDMTQTKYFNFPMLLTIRPNISYILPPSLMPT